MMSIIHLIWIIPVSMAAGFILCCKVPVEHETQTCEVDREKLLRIVNNMERIVDNMSRDYLYDRRRDDLY